MSKHRIKVLRITSVFIWVLSIYLLINIVAYFLPLDVSNLESFTDRHSYSTGETIQTTNVFESFENAESTYDSRIVCRNGVEKRAFLQTVIATTTPRPPAITVAEYTVPDNITGEHCVIQITAHSCVQVLPLIERCVTEISETNTFAIREE